ncbi:MAG: lamin tail domain-containing protein, partial [Planctomycetota bacterium]
TSFKDLLVAGDNVLAIHALAGSLDKIFPDFGTGDMLMLPQVLSRTVTILPPRDPDPGGVLYYTTDGTDPRGLDGQPTAAAAILGKDDSIVINENTRIIMRNLDEIDHGPESGLVTTDWSAPVTHNFIVNPVELTITEINYNPADPSAEELAAIPGVGNDDFEFIEILNAGTETMDLTGVELTNGVTFDFTTGAISSLAAGEYMLVVRDQAAFEARYGAGLPIAGEYDGSLSNNGERLTLVDGLDNALHSTEYSDSRIWPQTADGVGATLQLKDPTGTAADLVDKHYVWRGSTEMGGSPGTAGAGPLGVVVNEVLAHSDPPAVDTIELLNTTGAAINIGGWYLSDAAGNLQKFQIPADTMLGAGQYIVFDETNFNVGDNGFGLSSGNGDDVWLTVPDGNGGIGSFVDDAHFIASLAGESFGRVPNGEGALAPMLENTFGGDNSLPRVGPLIISEFNYNPGTPSAAALAIDANLTADDLEFVEIHNPTTSEVDLSDWRLRGAVDDTIADGTMIGVGETVVLISFNPDNYDNILRLNAFREHYGINDSVRLLGGYNGELSDNGELVELQRADLPEAPAPLPVAHVSEDFVIYDNLAPWPTGASGNGSSLHRKAPSLFGNVATSWVAATPSPGTAVFGDLPGDFNDDGSVDADDINILFGAISEGNMASQYDLNNSGTVDQADVEFLVENIIGTFMGDANLDGKVDAMDLNQVGINWQRMDGAGWSNGDFTGDGAVSAQDLNLIGINWRNGEAAAAHGRAPRA